MLVGNVKFGVIVFVCMKEVLMIYIMYMFFLIM